MQENDTNVDCLEHIFSTLSIRQRESCREVCRKWFEAVEQLDRGQKSLHIYCKIFHKDSWSSESSFNSKSNLDCELFNDEFNNKNTIIPWTTNFMRFDDFCHLLDRFPNLKIIKFSGIDHWNDHLLKQLTNKCPLLTQLSFVRCLGLGRSRMYEKNNYMNVTISGWNHLIEKYGQQVTKLSIHDCDLSEQQLELLIMGFRVLTHLDIGSNRIGEASALKNLCPSIQVLSVGSRLSGVSTGTGSIASDIPIESIVKGHGKYLKELHLQGFLSVKLNLISIMSNLETLVLRFVKPFFEDSTFTTCFASIGQLKNLKRLELHQYNTHDCYMTVGREQMFAILQGCSNTLEHLTLQCDIWCDTPVDDELIAHLSKQCQRLRHLDLCPGNFQTSDYALQSLSTMPSLEYVRLVEFGAISERGVLSMLCHSNSIQSCILDDCCNVNVENVFQTIKQMNAQNPSRRLVLSITPVCSRQMITEILHCPSDNYPQMIVKIFGKKERLSSKTSKFNLIFGHLEGLSSLTSHLHLALDLVNILLNLLFSILTIISTFTTFFIACLFYGLHLGLLKIKNRQIAEWIHFSPLTMSNLQTNIIFLLLAISATPLICLLISLFI